MRQLILVSALVLAHPTTGWAQAAPAVSRSAPARPPASIGQPPRYWPYLTAGALLPRGHEESAAFTAGVMKPLLNPVTGLAAAAGEAYIAAGGGFDGVGLRALASSPLFGLSLGADWHISDGRVDALLSFRTAVRRGGIVGGGTMVRLDWLPTRGRTVGLSLHVPVGRPLAGATRPPNTAIFLTDGVVGDVRELQLAPDPGTMDDELRALQAGAEAVRVLGNPYHEPDAVIAALAGSDAIDEYHARLRRLLGNGVDSATADRIAQEAREGLLEHVLIPYNQLFGVVKGNDGIAELTDHAGRMFSRWMQDSLGRSLPAAQEHRILGVHDVWMRAIEQVHRRLAEQWDDSRSIWLPMQLALRAEDFDEQAEIDSVIARMVARPFTDDNALTLLRSGDLPLEIARSIYAARKYHVLWMHDFAGVRDRTGELDLISYEMVSDAYFPALTEAVKRYDATGRFPAYMIFLDQFFYASRNGRLWMTMLEDPLHAELELPGDNAAREDYLRRRQAELRAAVAASTRLQANARAAGDDWLRRTVKVHVNITQPSDFSFRSHHIVPPIPFTPDNIMRDHRKIAFYDLDEADPYGGALFLMGVGIGEHYASETWEDRGYRVRGPAALEAREALRELMARHEIDPTMYPLVLRPASEIPGAADRRDDADYVGRALQVHNTVGFGLKESSVVRAVLYDLVQPRTIIIAPDPLWLSSEWGGMLAGAAARGAQVQVIAPAAQSAPSPQAPLLALSHMVLSRLVRLSAVIDGATPGAGVLRIGLFTAQAATDDVAGRRREVREGIARAPWITELIPFDDRALAVLQRAEAVAATSTDATEIASDEEPRPQQLHQKTQLIARPGAVAAFVRQPGWEDALAASLVAQQERTETFAELLGATTPESDETAMNRANALLLGYEQAIPEAERRRRSFYFALGTQNHDPRGLMLDGEATLLVSGVPAAAGLVDLYYLMARSTWVDTQAELDALLPPPGWVMRLIAKIARPAL